jgi:hypothetical protein
VLLKYADRASITDIQRAVGVSRPTIYKCIDKAVAAGVLVGLKDRFHRPNKPEITLEAKAWVVNLACTRPKEHALAAELWTLSVYLEISSQAPMTAGANATAPVYSVSVDVKPGVQALGVTAPELPPVPSQHFGIGRDHECVRHGTLSILAALDLHSGEIFAEVELRHRSRSPCRFSSGWMLTTPSPLSSASCWSTIPHISRRKP